MRLSTPPNLSLKNSLNPLGTSTSSAEKVSGASEKEAFSKHLKDAENVAKEFESLFMNQVVKGMRKTVPAEENSNAQSIFTEMLDTEHAKAMTESREFGIRQMIMDWMKTTDPKLALKEFQKTAQAAQEQPALNIPKPL